MKKILITGAGGFIGQNLTEFFKGKYELLTPARRELDLLDEFAVTEYFSKNQIDVVIHCANVGATRKTDNLPQIVGNNLRMFLNLARQEKYFERMIFFGSGAEFDKREDLQNISESYSSKYLPEGDYGLSKYLCSHFISESKKIINLRIFGVYGRYDDYQNRFISNALCRAVLGLPIIVFQNQLMSFIFVDDLVKITGHFVEHQPKEKFYHTASLQPVTLLSVAEKIKEISGKDLEIKVLKPGTSQQYSCTNQRLMGELGEFKFTDFDESLKTLYEWYKNNKTLLDPKILS